MRQLLLAISIAVIPSAALADRIDGQWCNDKGGRVEIKGPQISIAGKPSFPGQYGRHDFIYTSPAGEPDAGAMIYLKLRGEEDMTSFTVKDNQTSDPVDWKRCQATS